MSMIFGPAIAIIEVKSTGLGYDLLNQIAESDSLRVLSSGSANAFYILLNGEAAQLKAGCKTLLKKIKKSDLIDNLIVDQIHSEVLPAFFAQAKPELQTALGVCECKTLSAAFQGAQVAAEAGAQLIDLRPALGTQPAHFFFTTPDAALAKKAMAKIQAKLKGKKTLVRGTLISPTTQALQKYF